MNAPVRRRACSWRSMEAADDPVDGYNERVAETMRSMLGCTKESLVGIGNFTSPRIASRKW